MMLPKNVVCFIIFHIEMIQAGVFAKRVEQQMAEVGIA